MKSTSDQKKVKMTSKMKTTSKIAPLHFFAPPSPWKNTWNFLLMTSYLDSHTTTDIQPEMLSGVQTRNWIPRDEYDIRGIAHSRRNRKDNIFKKRRLV